MLLQKPRLLVSSLFLVVASVLLAFPIAGSVGGDGVFPAADIGFWVCLQYTAMALGMFGVWRSSVHWTTQQFRWLIGLALLLRLLLIPVDSYTSNDIKRYLWDGKVALSGYDPYRTAPASLPPSLHEQWAPPPEHNAYPSLYPPLAMGMFSLAATAGPQGAFWVWKIVVFLAGAGLLLVGCKLLKQLGQQRHTALLALSPILVLEGGIAAHLDIFSALAIVVAIVCWLQRRYTFVGVAVGLGVLVKLLPIVLLPVMWFLLHQWPARWRLLAGCLLTLLVGYGVAFALGWQPAGILLEFFDKWRFGSPLFVLIGVLMSETIRPLVIAGLVALGMWLAVSVGRRDAVRGFGLALMVPLLLSPVVFPWYLSVLVIFSALRPGLFLAAWLLLLPLSYEVLGGWLSEGVWRPATWVLMVILAGWLSAIAYWLVRFSPFKPSPKKVGI
ncbi:hypothetical protein ACVBEJ_03950 [Porticoccus sp. GXU_MW_L64]